MQLTHSCMVLSSRQLKSPNCLQLDLKSRSLLFLRAHIGSSSFLVKLKKLENTSVRKSVRISWCALWALLDKFPLNVPQCIVVHSRPDGNTQKERKTRAPGAGPHRIFFSSYQAEETREYVGEKVRGHLLVRFVSSTWRVSFERASMHRGSPKPDGNTLDPPYRTPSRNKKPEDRYGQSRPNGFFSFQYRIGDGIVWLC
jgi:hypothetical protein